MATPRNLLYIMSDEHNAAMLGCDNHPLVRTPNLDRLAERGTRFSSAYTNSPICIPARAAFATGRYTHETRFWDNAMPYDGTVRSWGHRLQDEGLGVESIGKLHYRGDGRNTGFSRELQPMHVMGGIGQVWGSVRDPLPEQRQQQGGGMLGKIGPGLSSYNRYDRKIAEEARRWIAEAADRKDERPWVLYLGFVAPHFPLTVPQPYYDLYPLEDIPEPRLHPDAGHVRHPWLQRMDDFQQVDRKLTSEERRMATAAYFGLCSFVDELIGEVLEALDASGLAKTTRVIYTSDHGDNVGARGLWGKSNMYEEAARVPLIIAGDDIPENTVCRTPVSLIDSYQTILDAVGLDREEQEYDLPGASWIQLANSGEDPDRVVFSEYHAAGSPSAAFMVRRGSAKLIHYVDYEPELFDLDLDPGERQNRSQDPEYAGLLEDLDQQLRAICDPEATDRAAKNDQNELVARFGGPEQALGTGTPGATPVPPTILSS